MKSPAYLDSVVRMWRDGIIAPGRITHIEVAHDNWCAWFHDGVCDCTPVVTVRAGKVAA